MEPNLSKLNCFYCKPFKHLQASVIDKKTLEVFIHQNFRQIENSPIASQPEIPASKNLMIILIHRPNPWSIRADDSLHTAIA
jgi:hypothetical protein